MDLEKHLLKVFPDAHFIERVPSNGDLSGISNPLFKEYKVANYNEARGCIEAVNTRTLNVYKRMKDLSVESWQKFLLEEGIKETSESFAEILEPSNRAAFFLIWKDSSGLFLSNEKYPYARSASRIRIDEKTIQNFIKPQKLIVQRQGSVDFFKECDPPEALEAVIASTDLLDAIYQNLSKIGIDKRYKPGWIFYKMRDAETEIQQFWNPLGLYQSIEDKASEYADRYESEVFPEQYKRRLEALQVDYLYG